MVIKLDIEVGDIVLTGRFKNKRTKVKTIGTDEFGHPTINGKPILKLRIEKLMPKDKQSKQTREELDEHFSVARFQKLAGVLKEQSEKVRYQPDEVSEVVGVVYCLEAEDDPYHQNNLYSIHKTREGAERALKAFLETDDAEYYEPVITEYKLYK